MIVLKYGENKQSIALEKLSYTTGDLLTLKILPQSRFVTWQKK